MYTLLVAALSFAACSPAHHAMVVEQPPPRAEVQQPPAQEEASFQVFYDQLGPYGRWIDYPGEGYVWAPNVEAGFQPYATNGHWVYSEQGWTWASSYPWGWAAFHYGRWSYEEGYGWLWLPGHEWAPAWVTWGRTDGYYGWAPLGPHIASGQQWSPPQQYWSFVPAEHINKPNIANYVVDRSANNTIIQKVTIINNTTINNRTIVNNTVNNTVNNVHVNNNNTTVNNNNTVNNVHVNNNNATINNNSNNNTVINKNNVVINNTVINRGPQVKDVEAVTKAHVQQLSINEHSKPAATQVTNNSVTIYRPVIRTNGVEKNGNRPAPQKVENYRPGPPKR